MNKYYFRKLFKAFITSMDVKKLCLILKSFKISLKDGQHIGKIACNLTGIC